MPLIHALYCCMPYSDNDPGYKMEQNGRPVQTISESESNQCCWVCRCPHCNKEDISFSLENMDPLCVQSSLYCFRML